LGLQVPNAKQNFDRANGKGRSVLILRNTSDKRGVLFVIGNLTRSDSVNEFDDLSRRDIAEPVCDGFELREGLFEQVVFSFLMQGSQRPIERLLQCLCGGRRLRGR